MDQQDFQFWGPIQVKTAKFPKKVVSITRYRQLLELDQKQQVAIFEAWLYPQQSSDKKVLQALLQLNHVKQVSIYGRKSDIVTRTELKFPPLRKLRFGECQLPQIYPFIYTNTSITQLNLNSNNITYLPPEMSQMKNLKQLFLFEHKIVEFPKVILQLTQLQKLDLNHGPLISVPEQIGVLKNLTRLFLNHNPDLATIPKIIVTGLKSLKAFSANGTKWGQTGNAKQVLKQLKRKGVLLV